MKASGTVVIGVALVACAVLLSGCSNGKFAYGNAFNDLKRVSGLGKSAGVEQALPTPPEPGPPLLVGYEAIRVAIPYAGQSGPSKTYKAVDGVTIAMNSGFVTRATGLGFDMNGSYLPNDSAWFDNMAAAAKTGESTDRIVEYWEKGRAKRDKFRCTLSSAPRAGGGVVVDELCKRYFNPTGFTNRYWLDGSGSIECSRQWIHPKLSPLQFFRTEQQASTLNLTTQGC